MAGGEGHWRTAGHRAYPPPYNNAAWAIAYRADVGGRIDYFRKHHSLCTTNIILCFLAGKITTVQPIDFFWQATFWVFQPMPH